MTSIDRTAGINALKKASEQGDPKAQVELALRYFRGEGVDQNTKEGFKWLLKAAGTGDAVALCYLGFCYFHGTGVTENKTEAVVWFQKSAEQGFPEALFQLHLLYVVGEGVEEDKEKALMLLQKAAEQGHGESREILANIWRDMAEEEDDPEAQHALAVCYYHGNGVEKDRKEAARLFRKAAEQGYAESQVSLGQLYLNGDGVKRDHAEMRKWLQKAAEQGHEQAQKMLYGLEHLDEAVSGEDALKFCREMAERGEQVDQRRLGVYYLYGIEGVEKDVNEAVKWLRKAADQGDMYAQYYLGTCYHDGNGVEVDMEEAFKWFRKAAEQGCADAQYNLGVFYLNRLGVESDKEEALKWLRKAAEQGEKSSALILRRLESGDDNAELDFEYDRSMAEEGNPKAQFNLSRRYYNGDGVAEDKQEAMKWCRKAAEQGHVIALFNLGMSYINGDGVGKDAEEGINWLKKAAEQGFKPAQDNLRYFSNLHLGKKDVNEMLPQWREEAERGNASSQFELGCCYLFGEGVEADASEAEKYLRKAAEQGYEKAQIMLESIVESNRQLAEQGDTWGQYRLGMNYFHGVGVDKDWDEAIKWLQKAAKEFRDSTPLHLLILTHDYEAVRWFIENEADLEAKNEEGRTPLDWAATDGNPEICRLLLDAGADVNVFDHVRRTPFHEAIWNWSGNRHQEVCQMLLDAGADIHALDDDDETPLHWAAKHGPLEALEFLLAHGARTDLKDNQGQLPIDVVDSEDKKTALLAAMQD